MVFILDNTPGNGLNGMCVVKSNDETLIRKYHSTIYIDGRIHLERCCCQTTTRDVPAKIRSRTALVSGELTTGHNLYEQSPVYAFSKAAGELPVFSLTATAIVYWAIGGYIPNTI